MVAVLLLSIQRAELCDALIFETPETIYAR